MHAPDIKPEASLLSIFQRMLTMAEGQLLALLISSGKHCCHGNFLL